MKIVIVGSGAAALAAREAILSSGARAETTLVSRESDAPYSKVALPRYISGQIDRARLFLPVMGPPGAEGEKRSTELPGTNVVWIDRAGREVFVEGPSGSSVLPYDRLILALGATPSQRFGQPVWTLGDADRVRSLVSTCKTAAVIGGGFVGLQMVAALQRAGVKVTVLEREKHLLPGRTPSRFGEFLEMSLRRTGVCVRTGALIDRVWQTDGAWEVSISYPRRAVETARFDLCLDCTGARPEVGLAEKAGLAVWDRGIVVDACQRTSDPDVLAAGDCAAVVHTFGEIRSAGLHHQASAQGRVAGLVAVGQPAEMPPSTGWHTFEVVCEAPLQEGLSSGPSAPRVACSFGDLVPKEGDKVIESGDPAGDDYRHAIVRGRRVVGYFQTTEPSGLGGLIERLGEPASSPQDLSAARLPGPFALICAPQPLPIDTKPGKVIVRGSNS